MRYQSDTEFVLKIHMIPALAFVPPKNFTTAFEELQEIMPQEADSIIDYFEDNHIGRLCRRNSAIPRFPMNMWNIHQRVVDSLPHTNNSSEV